MGLADLSGEWVGNGELWLDEAGNEARRHPCTLTLDGDTLRYTWTYEDRPQEGMLRIGADRSARWIDSWHQPTEVACRPEPESWALVGVRYEYSAPTGPDWGWRIAVCARPSGQLVVQMTNVTPWGEEARAVRMVFERQR